MVSVMKKMKVQDLKKNCNSCQIIFSCQCVVEMQDNKVTIGSFEDLDWCIKKSDSSSVEDTSNWDMVLDKVGGLDASLAVGVASSGYVYVAGILADTPGEARCSGDHLSRRPGGESQRNLFHDQFPLGRILCVVSCRGIPSFKSAGRGKDGMMVDI